MSKTDSEFKDVLDKEFYDGYFKHREAQSYEPHIKRILAAHEADKRQAVREALQSVLEEFNLDFEDELEVKNRIDNA